MLSQPAVAATDFRTHLTLLTFTSDSAPTDLAREVSKEIPNVKVDFMKASSYGAASESTGDVTVQGASNLAKWDNYNILLVSTQLQQVQQGSTAQCSRLSQQRWRCPEILLSFWCCTKVSDRQCRFTNGGGALAAVNTTSTPVRQLSELLYGGLLAVQTLKLCLMRMLLPPPPLFRWRTSLTAATPWPA